jgi:DNA ligase-1
VADPLILKAVEFGKLSSKFRKKWADEQALWEAGWLAQRKYDGCFGMAVITDYEAQMLSRTGEDYTTSCAHILAELQEAAACWVNFGPFIVLGEVWHPDLSFPTISGQFRKRAPSKLWFMANDILPIRLESNLPYAQRLSNLQSLLPEVGSTDNCYVRTVQPIPFTTDRTIMQEALALQGLGGYDGAILRDCGAGYSPVLVKNGEIVKVKPTLSLDLLCVELKEAVGEKTGRPVYTVGVRYKGLTTWVGSGVPHEWAAAPSLGQIVEIECLGITEDGKLREPRFKGIRFDKKEPDA